MDAKIRDEPRMNQSPREAIAGKLQVFADFVLVFEYAIDRWEILSANVTDQ